MVLEDGHKATGDGAIGDTGTDIEGEDGVYEKVEKCVTLRLDELSDTEVGRLLFLHPAAASSAGWRCGKIVLSG